MERIAVILGKMNGGGVEKIVCDYYRHLDHAKYQFDFFAESCSKRVDQLALNATGAKVFYLPPVTHVCKYVKTLRNYLSLGNYRIMHVHLNALSVFALFAGKLAKVPVRISHNHSTSSKAEFFRHFVKQLLKPFAKIFATHFCACSSHAGKWLFGNDVVSQGKLNVVNNATNASQFAFDQAVRQSVRANYGWTDDFVVGSVGRFVQQKNYAFLIRCFARLVKSLPQAKLVLIGDGKQKEKLLKQAKKLGVLSKVQLLGYQQNVSPFYQAFDVFALPSRYEGFGTVVVEAQTNGLPCVVSTSVPRQVDLTGNVKFVPLKAMQWTQALQQATFHQRKDCSKQIAQRGFDLQQASKKLQSFYDDLIQNNKNTQNNKNLTQQTETTVKPLVSVLVPVYNVKQYLARCVDSILNQTYDNLQVVLCDDGSTDGSDKLCDKYLADKRVTVVHQTNKGLAQTRNVLLGLSKGEYVTFVDSDDAVSPFLVEHLVQAITQSGASMSFCNFCKVYDDKGALYNPSKCRWQLLDTQRYLQSVLYQQYECNAWGKLYKRQLTSSLVYPNKGSYEDVAVLQLLLNDLQSVAVVSNVDYYYTQRSQSILHKQYAPSDDVCLQYMSNLQSYVNAKYPLLNKAMDCRYFSATCSLFLRVDKAKYPRQYKLLWQQIKAYRRSVATNKRARAKAWIASVVSYFGANALKTVFTIFTKK